MSRIPTGTIATLTTNRRNGIKPMIEIISDEGAWIKYHGAFGGSKIKRTRRSRLATILL